MKLKSLFCLLILSGSLHAQYYDDYTFTRADSLRGALRPERTCFDVTKYELNLEFDMEGKRIKGYNDIHFKVVKNFRRLQLDLFENMSIDSIVHGGFSLDFEREGDAIFIETRYEVAAGHNEVIRVYYHGQPTIAKNAPWDGGFVWTKDAKGNPWASVACEGDGASLWWPNKDHLGDEPDSMRINLTVPKALQAISNGRLHKVIKKGEQSEYRWKVSYPINNYNVSFYIGQFALIKDQYKDLDLSYYVLKENKKKAKKHFMQTSKMLEAFEHYFGEYPFKNDGYKLVDAPYWGMEHQSGIAYGHDYTNNEFGFDFIIVHESGHEWWGNHVSMADHADLWIHEAFTTYSELLYVEYFMGYDRAVEYLQTIKRKIRNNKPFHGPYNVNFSDYGSADMYYKGAAMLHQFRLMLANDDLWFSILKGLQREYAYRNITTTELINFINQKTGTDFSSYFAQYIDTEKLPVLEYGILENDDKLWLHYRYRSEIKNYKGAVLYKINDGEYQWLSPSRTWQKIKLDPLTFKEITFKEDEFLVDFKKLKSIAH